MMKLFAAAVLAAGLAGIPASSHGASADEPTEAEKIMSRAVGLMAQARDYSVESDTVWSNTTLEDGKTLSVRTCTHQSSREPGLYWSETMSYSGSRGLAWSDGKVLREFNVMPGHPEYGDGVISERVLLEGDYQMILGHRFDRLSVFGGLARGLLMKVLNSQGRIPGGRYAGREELRGELCDVIEVTRDIPQDQWSVTRSRYPQVPEQAAEKIRIYLRAADGRLLRTEETNWGYATVNGVESDHLNMRSESYEEYRYGPALPASEIDLAHFEATVRGAMRGKQPKIVQRADEWRGKSLPDIQMTRLDGKPVRWQDFKGKVLVVETWFIGCTYCKNAFPYYDRMREALKSQGVVFMALNTGDAKTNSASHIRSWMEKNKDRFDFLWTKSIEAEQAIYQKLNFYGAPVFFVVGTDGKVVASYPGYGYGNGGEDPRLIEALKGAGVKL